MVKKLLLLFFLAVVGVNCKNLHNEPQPSVEEEIQLTFMFGSHGRQTYSVFNFPTIFDHPEFVRNRITVIYHYGFTQTPNSAVVQDVVNAYTQRNIVNFVLVHYDGITTNSITNARQLGEAIGDSLVQLFDRGYSAQNMHLVGFSLGAQIMSIAARRVQSASSRRFTVARLTGLDPGQIPGIWLPFTGRLSSGDAVYVDSIHTEAVGFGDHESRGHAAFFPNGGVSQPHCTQTIQLNQQTCSHEFAVTAWAESVRALTPTFPSLSCTNWDMFISGQCNSNTVGNKGQQTQTTLRGSFFLRTNLFPPWSRTVATP
ncbi:hypothetical protein PVAND_011909 [Polypedilum vanderplanki]|uniref:Lipase domain-containing protein n=1 Tax=Polypedilum vanderplanki TaxID=319348 RepID=A0A9J6CKQ7_POLVA|nr:hypothetical protein PVAND_011909 [Polypedilum vanderplanki]